MEEKINKGDIFYANLDGALGSEQQGNRPVLIVQNDIGNKYSPTTIILPLTKIINRKHKLPTHFNINKSSKIKCDSTILAEQIRVIDKKRLGKKIGNLDKKAMQIIDNKIQIALGIIEFWQVHNRTLFFIGGKYD